MIEGIIKFLWANLVRYVVTRCTGTFMDELFDSALVSFTQATPSKVDDELLEKWKAKK